MPSPRIHFCTRWPVAYWLIGMLALGAATSRAFAVARLGPLNMSNTAGATLEIPIGFTSSEQVTCLQFDLLFDPARVSLGSARSGTSAAGHQVESASVSSGRQRVVLYSTTLASLDGGYIVQVPVTWALNGDSNLAVEAVQLATPEATAVAFTSSNLSPELTSNAPGGAAPRGGNVALDVEPVGGNGVTYEWRFNGAAIPGATSATFTIASAQGTHAGVYQVIVSVNGLILASQDFTLTIEGASPARLLNLSTRGLSQTGDNVLIPGFVIQGNANKRLLIRAVGPTLSHPPYNIVGALANPRMTLKRLDFSTTPPVYLDVATNDDWRTNDNAAQITQTAADLFAFVLEDDREAALLMDLAAGQYTVVADGVGGATGITIVELYDADTSAVDARLINLSNRGFAGVGDQVMIPGFVISAEGSRTVLLRVVGPTLAGAPYSVAGTMTDPKLALYKHNFTTNADDLLLTQDNWSDSPGATQTEQTATEVSAFPLDPGSADAALVITLEPGVYTVVGAAADGVSTGVVLVEVYVVP